MSNSAIRALKPNVTQEEAVRAFSGAGVSALYWWVRSGDARIEITPVRCELHLPYWLGFYERDGSVRCRVMDAVRRRMEGAKACAFFEQWLAA